MQSAIARAEQARITYQSQIDGVHTSVARLRAELRDAEYNLELTVRAPASGFVTQLALRPGMYLVPAPFRPATVFVNVDGSALAAGFQQNALLRVKPGDEAEIAFDGARDIFKGKVQRPGGDLVRTDTGQQRAQEMWAAKGRAVAIIELEAATDYKFPGGSAAQVACAAHGAAASSAHPPDDAGYRTTSSGLLM
jgi:multidrug resistance efflux pump